MQFRYTLAAACLLGLLSACSQSSEDQTTFATLTTSKTLPSGDANCPFSGLQIDSGADTNENGFLDQSEITSTQFECNAEGSDIILNDEVQAFFGADPNLEDTDGDGLTDVFEILEAVSLYEPNQFDTDGNGIEDGLDDTDQDGLTALEEFDAGTSVFQSDTDGDGLLDGFEVKSSGTDPITADSDGDTLSDGEEYIKTNTNPLLRDSDGNGVDDNEEVYTVEIDAPQGVELSATGRGNLDTQISILEFADSSEFNGNLGQVGKAIDISLDSEAQDFDGATLSFEFDPSSAQITDPADLRVFTFNEELGFWVPAGDVNGQQIDTVNNRVTANLEHFSVYALFDYLVWQDMWSQQTDFCIPAGEAQSVDSNVALVLDTSGSLRTTDPSNLRTQGAIAFLGALGPNDQAAVVDYDSSARTVQSLTSNRASLESALRSLDQSGGTNIGAGVREGLNVLSSSPTGTNKVMLLFNDGTGSYDSTQTTRAINDRVRIFTIGLGTGIDSSLLQDIATRTGGVYTEVRDASNLIDAFTNLQSSVSDDGTDTDQDGLTDCQEENGVLSSRLIRYKSDPLLPDTDGDGLTDFEEVGERTSLSTIPGEIGNSAVHPVYSDPSLEDTDSDGLLDGEEYDYGSSPFETDTDGDGLSDFEESSIGTDPVNRDTDGDSKTTGKSLDDLFEHQNRDDGFDPLFPTEAPSQLEYYAGYIKGLIAGDFAEIDTLPEFAGQITSGLVVLGDARDLVANLFKGDLVGAGLSVVGVFPLLGDAGKIAGDYVSLLGKNPRIAAEALGSATRIAPDDIALQALRIIDDTLIDSLRSAGMSDEAVLRIVRNGKGTNSLDNVAAALARSNTTTVRNARFYDGATGWRQAEDDLRSAIQSSTARPSAFDTSVGSNVRRGKRFPDAFNEATGLMAESKTGYVTFQKRILTQIQKDAELLRGTDVRKVEWHFYASGRSNSIGADPRILDALESAGIDIVYHLP